MARFVFLVTLLAVAIRLQVRSEDKSYYCMGRDKFVFSFQLGNFLVLHSKELVCPLGYVCGNQLKYPCVLEADGQVNQTTESATETGSSSAPEKTTLELTTLAATSSKPTTTSIDLTTFGCYTPYNPPKPVCRATNELHPGPTCAQYYRCSWSWWNYNLQLHTCSAGTAFSSSQKKCVVPQTDCACVE